MIISHGSKHPQIHPDAWVAPDATVCGDVRIGAGSRIMHGARIVAEAGGAVEIGIACVVLENAVVRATARHNCFIGDHCLLGPGSHVVGAHLAGRVFVATGASVFHGAKLAEGVEVRINAVVHIKATLEAGTTVPIGWVAVGEPTSLFPPDRHDKIWALQKPANFPDWVYGVDRMTPDVMKQITQSLSRALGTHATDVNQTT